MARKPGAIKAKETARAINAESHRLCRHTAQRCDAGVVAVVTGGNGTQPSSCPSSYRGNLLRSVERLRPVTLLLICALGLLACSYSPPDAGDLNRPSYQADLATCQEIADKEAHHR